MRAEREQLESECKTEKIRLELVQERKDRILDISAISGRSMKSSVTVHQFVSRFLVV